MSISAMRQAMKALQKIHQGCGDVQEEPDIHKDAKNLATYVRKDCIPAISALEQAIKDYELTESAEGS